PARGRWRRRGRRSRREESSARRPCPRVWRRQLQRRAARTRRAVAERIGAGSPPPCAARRARHVPPIACRMRPEMRSPHDCASYPRAGSDLHRSKCVHTGEVVRAGPGPGYKGPMTTERPKAIDGWLNLPVGFTNYRPEFLIRVARDYFKREKEIFEPAPLPELLGQMDAAGVERAVITIDASNPEPF